jgi:hypothetical protein
MKTMKKDLSLAELTALVDILTSIYQEGKAEENDLIIDLVKDALDVLSTDE